MVIRLAFHPDHALVQVPRYSVRHLVGSINAASEDARP
jgi:hypothetical protein